jgi:hypothetical protein
MTNAEAARKMVEILDNDKLSEWDVNNKIAILIRDFEGVENG